MANWQAGQPLAIRTKNYLLRSLSPKDATDTYISWWNDAEIQRGFNMPARNWSRAEAQKHISNFNNKNSFHLGIFQQSTGKMIGFFAMFVDYQQRVAKSNICIGDKSLWGKNIGLEVRRAMLNFMFGPLGMEKVEGEVQGRNLPSFYNYKVLGFKLEGVLREHMPGFEGGRVDIYLFGILKEDWIKALKEGKNPAPQEANPDGQ